MTVGLGSRWGVAGRDEGAKEWVGGGENSRWEEKNQTQLQAAVLLQYTVPTYSWPGLEKTPMSGP